MKFRDVLWNYPDILSSITRVLAPFSYIFISAVVVFSLGYYYYASGGYERMVMQKDSGIISEGTVGYLGNLNPIYVTQSQVDRDIQSLIFRKLVRVDSEGKPYGDIVSNWSVSSDLLTYSFTIAPNVLWHDGTPVTSDDVIFTFNTARELSDKLSQETVGQGFDGLKVQKVNSSKFTIVLDQYSATFWESISIYLIPSHVLKDVPISSFATNPYSKKPLGNNYFEVLSSTDSHVQLGRSSRYESDIPINTYNYYIFRSPEELETAFRNNKLDIISGVSLRNVSYINEYARRFDVIQKVISTRKKVLFFNNRVSSLGNTNIRKGIGYILDKERLLKESGIDGDIALSSFSTNSWAFEKGIDYYTYSKKKADVEFSTAGFKKDTDSGFYKSEDGKILTFTITYLDNDINNLLATSIKDLMEQEGIIIEFDPQTYERLTKETLATRDFEILLFEIETSIDPDQYDLWHSLRVDYPFLNLSGYANDRVDIFLERGRTQVKHSDRLQSYLIVQRLLNEDIPSLFLYEPKFTLIVSNDIEGISLESINYPEERYNTILSWK